MKMCANLLIINIFIVQVVFIAVLVSVALAAEYQPEYPVPAASAYPATYPFVPRVQSPTCTLCTSLLL